MTLTDNEKKFLDAASNGDLDTINSLIRRNKISLERHDKIRNEDGFTALTLASWCGQLNIVRFLVKENSVNVDGKDTRGFTALHYASIYDHVDMMELLIANGANVDQQDGDGRTPLHWARGRSKLSAVDFLLERGANTHIQDKYNRTALDYARPRRRRTDVVREENTANHQKKIPANQSPNHQPILKMTDSAMHRMARGFYIDKFTGFDRVAGRQIRQPKFANNEEKFLWAAREGNLKMIKALTTTRRRDGKPLISIENHDQIKDHCGQTALLLASEHGHLEIVRFLLGNNSVDINGHNNYGATSLHCASKGHVEIMKLLIHNGANINQQDNDGFTPLHIASIRDSLSVVKLLLDMWADPTIQNSRNETALDWAKICKHNTIEQHIRQQQQIQELIRCNDRLPIAVWPDAFSRLKSVHFIYQIVCEIPQLLEQAPEKDQKP